MKRKGLGKGLEALLGDVAVSSVTETPVAKEKLRQIPVDLLQRGRYQPRREMDQVSLSELASSIRAQGVIQPIAIRSIGNNRYEIIAGERRWRAAQLAELQEIPAVVHDISDEAAMAIGLIENIQRKDLNAIEEMHALHRLQDEFNLTHQQIAEAIGKSRTTVTNILRLMNLNDDVKELLVQNKLEFGHAKVLLSLTGPQQSTAAKAVVDKGLNVRDTESLVQRLNAPKQIKIRDSLKDPDITKLEQTLAEQLGSPVTILHSTRGKGRIVIRYNSLDELDGVLEKFNQKDYTNHT